MNRKAKGLRTAGGVSILLNIIIFFLPMTRYDPVNYPTEKFSQWDYVLKVFSNEAPYGTDYSTERFMWMFFLILLPLLLSLVAGIWGVVGSDRQIVSSILIFITTALYMLLFISIIDYFPEDEYSWAIGGVCNLICCVAASIFSINALLVRREKIDEPILTEIPQVQEIRQEQVRAKYNIIQSDETSANTSNRSVIPETAPEVQKVVTEAEPISQMPPAPVIPPYVPGPPRGVMVGLTGIYAGAEIPFRDGESIRLGRQANNDLVFEGQDKVSRNHCYIKWNAAEQKFLIKDSSSNGTFVNESEDCLPQNIEIEIPIGTVIAIGDERNTFRLE